MAGEFDCLAHVPDDMLEEILAKFPPEMGDRMRTAHEDSRGHPDDEDIANAQAFAKNLIQRSHPSTFSRGYQGLKKMENRAWFKVSCRAFAGH